MSNAITILAPIKLASDKTEKDLMAASEKFQTEFVAKQPGILRRELIRTGEGRYMDIVLFKSKQDAQDVIAAEAVSSVCHEFFSVMDLTNTDMSAEIDFHASLAVYTQG